MKVTQLALDRRLVVSDTHPTTSHGFAMPFYYVRAAEVFWPVLGKTCVAYKQADIYLLHCNVIAFIIYALIAYPGCEKVA